jgi:hypothetical protein
MANQFNAPRMANALRMGINGSPPQARTQAPPQRPGVFRPAAGGGARPPPRQPSPFGLRPQQQARQAPPQRPAMQLPPPRAPMMQRPPQAPPPKPGMAPQRPPAASMSAGMGGAMMSDARSKERIRELEDLNDTYASLLDGPATAKPTPRAPNVSALDRAHGEQFRDAGSYEYSYKDPSHGEGRFAGPMAHELKRIPGVVKPTPEGDKVDPGRLSLATASVVGEHERELNDIRDDYEALLDRNVEYPRPRRPSL